jgi:hypothetical protein
VRKGTFITRTLLCSTRIIRNLYSTFITPWADQSAAHTVEPDFRLPSCYANVQAPPPGPAKAGAFSDETLFFMFYSSSRDALQEVAAQELCVMLKVLVQCKLTTFLSDTIVIGGTTRSCGSGSQKRAGWRLRRKCKVANRDNTHTGSPRTGPRSGKR